ncbi:LysR family transcriptional regulator [Lacibacterium aquatile]|uniref:LysR family transcriptional regulator n=1 Tax=Lacibacterium aquatile TaxID=1168082 RepID=A0ABW5DRP7_9PROT
MDLKDLDLNLLKLFDAVWQERHVGRAAMRLGLTQPAASNGLARLRTALGDPLFIKTPSGMVPTTRAEELAPIVAEVLLRLRSALRTSADFDPASASGSVTFGLSDHAEFLLAPELAAHLASAAPGLALRLRHTDKRDALDLLERGELDLAIGVLPPGPAHVTRQILYRDSFAVLTSGPDVSTLDSFCAAEHLLVSAAGSSKGAVDTVLEAQGRSRRITLTVAHYGVVPAILRARPLICTLPRRLAERVASGCTVHDLPPGLEISAVPLTMLWHSRADADPLHIWIRRLIAEMARG